MHVSNTQKNVTYIHMYFKSCHELELTCEDTQELLPSEVAGVLEVVALLQAGGRGKLHKVRGNRGKPLSDACL